MHHTLALLLAVSAAAVIAAGAAGSLAEAPSAVPTQPAEVQPVEARAPAPEGCLSAADMREAVAEQRVIAPLAAIRAARQAYPRAEIQRAALCRHEGRLVYVLTALRREGQFVQVMVDAQSGQVRAP